MIRIGVLSDTHGFIDNKILDFFVNCDEIWHAGDIGSLKTADILSEYKPFKAVYGNIDSHDIRNVYPEHQRFDCENIDVWMTHIGGYPGNYAPQVKANIFRNPPRLFICGHSHILKVIFDEKLGLLHINPGAAGKNGLHRKRTAVRFTIDLENISDLEILELNRT